MFRSSCSDVGLKGQSAGIGRGGETNVVEENGDKDLLGIAFTGVGVIRLDGVLLLHPTEYQIYELI